MRSNLPYIISHFAGFSWFGIGMDIVAPLRGRTNMGLVTEQIRETKLANFKEYRASKTVNLARFSVLGLNGARC